MGLPEFAPTAREGEEVRHSPHGNWFWTCSCGFEASCLEDVGGHRSWHREQTAKLLGESVDAKLRSRR